MKNILIINCGSSSLKYKLMEMEEESLLASGLIERIGFADSKHIYSQPDHEDIITETEISDHETAIKLLTEALTGDNGVINNIEKIHAVGHRVVHAGEKFSGSVVITEDVITALEECIPLAPLHNPHNLTGIFATQKMLPAIPMVAVFDTAFHQTMPNSSYIYPIPYELYEKHSIRRYGFHGTSHRYVTHRAAELLERDKSKLNLITCHLGNGASVAAVKNGQSFDTSMGLTPLEGLMMGTRSGDIDPAMVGYLSRLLEKPVNEIETILNKKSGMLGISGVSSDLRDVQRAYANGNERAKLALEVYCYHIRKYIGAYAVALGTVDAIVFTAGVGEHDSLVREWSCQGLDIIGATLDPFKNATRRDEAIISKNGCRVEIMIIPTDEELMIARDTAKLVFEN